LQEIEILKSEIDRKRLSDIDFDHLRDRVREAEGGIRREELAKIIEQLGRLRAIPPDVSTFGDDVAANSIRARTSKESSIRHTGTRLPATARGCYAFVQVERVAR